MASTTSNTRIEQITAQAEQFDTNYAESAPYETLYEAPLDARVRRRLVVWCCALEDRTSGPLPTFTTTAWSQTRVWTGAGVGLRDWPGDGRWRTTPRPSRLGGRLRATGTPVTRSKPLSDSETRLPVAVLSDVLRLVRLNVGRIAPQLLDSTTATLSCLGLLVSV